MTIIIIEGPDLSGKSYAIEKIAKHFNSGFVLKNSYKPKTKENSKQIYAQYWSIINVVIDRQDIVILDRFYPSQAVYSYLRGQDEFEHPEIQALDIYAETMKFLYIYLDTPLALLKERYADRGDEHISIGMLEKLKSRYDKFFDQTKMKKIKVNTVYPGWLEKIEEFIK